MREYTMRGTMLPTEQTRSLVVDDGRYTHGFVITGITVWPSAPSMPAGYNANAVLSFLETKPATMNASESGTIGWASWMEGTTSDVSTSSVLDPQHVVNEDLFLHNMGGTAMNYLITMRPIVMSPEQGVLQLIKAANQSV